MIVKREQDGAIWYYSSSTAIMGTPCLRLAKIGINLTPCSGRTFSGTILILIVSFIFYFFKNPNWDHTFLRPDIFMANSGKVAKKLLVRHSSSSLSSWTIDSGSSERQFTSSLPWEFVEAVVSSSVAVFETNMELGSHSKQCAEAIIEPFESATEYQALPSCVGDIACLMLAEAMPSDASKCDETINNRTRLCSQRKPLWIHNSNFCNGVRST